jgi:zinc/manganese transport system substrate-binding protein
VQKDILDLGAFISSIDKATGRVDRSQGDVHPMGNPHYYLDPIRIKNVIPKITEKLIEFLPEKKDKFEQRLKIFSNALDKNFLSWQNRLHKLNTKNVITYHKTLLYFLQRFQINLIATIEPKPGIPPTASHSLELIELAKKNHIHCILNESHFETVAAQRISKEISGQVSVVPTEVGALPGTDTYTDLIEKLVTGLEACK